MRIDAMLSVLSALVLAGATNLEAQPLGERLQVTLVTDQAEAVLAILQERATGSSVETAAWERLFTSEGYRRLQKREAAMGVPFTDEEFRQFVVDEELLSRATSLRETLREWTSLNPQAAARRAFAYLPAGAMIRAKVYPVIKPKSNSFVFDLEGSPAIFLYLDPEVTSSKFENTVAHELHHIGLASACPDEDPELPEGVRRARRWATGFGEGVAMLAAAGGADVHPHAVSESEERQVWDRDLANLRRDMERIETFLLDLAEGSVTDEAEIRRRGFELIVSEGVPQGPFYTVGWHLAATVERELGRDRLRSALCDPATLLSDYNQAARAANRRGEDVPLWSTGLVKMLAED